MLHRWPLTAIALGIAVSTSAQEAITFKGLSLGAPRAEFLAAFPGAECYKSDTYCGVIPERKCPSTPTHPNFEPCHARYRYGPVLPKLISGTFEDDKLVSVYALIPEPMFGQLLATMQERWGEPNMNTVDRLQNSMGASFESRRVTWIRDDAVLTVRQRSGKIDESAVMLNSRSHMDRRAGQREQKAKEAAKDL